MQKTLINNSIDETTGFTILKIKKKLKPVVLGTTINEFAEYILACAFKIRYISPSTLYDTKNTNFTGFMA